MARRTAIVACLAAVVGTPLYPKQSPDSMFINHAMSIHLELVDKTGVGVKDLTVAYKGKELVITADEIWEALQPPKEPTR